MAMNHAAKHVMWLRNLFQEMGIATFIQEPTVLEGDNKQAGKWGREDMITSGNRFIERQYFKVRDWIRRGDLDARYINTKQNCADMLTKAVSVETAQTLGPMLSGEVPLPAMPEPEDAIKRF